METSLRTIRFLYVWVVPKQRFSPQPMPSFQKTAGIPFCASEKKCNSPPISEAAPPGKSLKTHNIPAAVPLCPRGVALPAIARATERVQPGNCHKPDTMLKTKRTDTSVSRMIPLFFTPASTFRTQEDRRPLFRPLLHTANTHDTFTDPPFAATTLIFHPAGFCTTAQELPASSFIDPQPTSPCPAKYRQQKDSSTAAPPPL